MRSSLLRIRIFGRGICFAGPRGGGIVTSDANRFLRLAELCFSRGERDNAINYLRQAATLKPKDPMDINRLATLKKSLCPNAADIAVPSVHPLPRFEPSPTVTNLACPPAAPNKTMADKQPPKAINKSPATQVVPPKARPQALQAPVPLPSGSTPLTRQERLQRILEIFKNKYREKAYARIIRIYEEYPKTIGNNVLALCYYFHARLATKFIALSGSDWQYPGYKKNSDLMAILTFNGRLERLIRALTFILENFSKGQKEMMTIDPTSFNLLNNRNRVIFMSEARAIVTFPPDQEIETRFAQELRTEFEKIIALEFSIESAEEKQAKKAREKAKQAAARIEARRQDAIRFFSKHPNASIKEIPGSVWVTLYRLKLFEGIEEAKRLAERDKPQ